MNESLKALFQDLINQRHIYTADLDNYSPIYTDTAKYQLTQEFLLGAGDRARADLWESIQVEGLSALSLNINPIEGAAGMQRLGKRIMDLAASMVINEDMIYEAVPYNEVQAMLKAAPSTQDKLAELDAHYGHSDQDEADRDYDSMKADNLRQVV